MFRKILCSDVLFRMSQDPGNFSLFINFNFFPVYRMRKIFFTDPCPNFTDPDSDLDSDPDPTRLPATVNKNNFFKHHKYYW